MSEADAERLSRVESVDSSKAKEALDRADGDFEKAQTIIKEAPVALKFRFASSEQKIYGLGLILLEASPPGMNDISVIVANDDSLGTVALKQSYSEFSTEVKLRSDQPSAMAALTKRLNDGLTETLAPPSEEWASLLKSGNESDLQNKLEERIRNILGENDIVLTLDLEQGMLQTDDSSSGSSESSSDNSTTTEDSEDVTLLCDLKVSPIKGKPVQQLNPGDIIYVDVQENKNENPRVIEAVEELRDDEFGLIPATIDSIGRTESGKVEITVQFGENIFGRSIAGEDMNILTPRSVVETDSQIDNIISFIPWVLVGLVLFLVGIIVLWNLVFPL